MFGGSLCRGGDLLVMTAGVAIMASILVPNFLKARQQGQLTACKSNLKNLATACEMWAVDHQEHYPQSLQELIKIEPGDEAPYMLAIPECPCFRGVEGYGYRYKVVPHPPGVDLDGYELACPDGSAHGLPEGEPRYSDDEGLIAGPPEGRLFAGLWEFVRDLPFFAMLGLTLLFFLGSLARRPDPPPRVQELLDRSKLLSALTSFSWFLLVSAAALGMLWISSSWPFFLLRVLVSCLLAGSVAGGVVYLGYGLWELLSPAQPARPAEGGVRERPGLTGAGQRAVLVPSAKERFQRSAIGFGIPALAMLVVVAGPALGPDKSGALQGSLLGLAVAALLSVPLYLWGKAWGTTFTQRELEWVPGTGQLLEYRWDGTRIRALGTTGELQSVEKNEQGYTVTINGECFSLPPGELAATLAAAVS